MTTHRAAPHTLLNATLPSSPAVSTSSAPGIVHLRPGQPTTSKQGLTTLIGISNATAGARGLCLNLVVVPPGGAAVPHTHQGYETAIYCLSGRIETRYGPGLRQSVVSEPGDFLYIGPDVPHQPINLSASEPAMAIVARNDANEQEHVLPYDPTSE